MSREKPQVGEKLIARVHSSGGRRVDITRTVTVSKVGRKWITVVDGSFEARIAVDSWRIDGEGFVSPGRCFRNERELREAVDSARGRLAFARLLHRRMIPEDVSLSCILRAAGLLRLGGPFEEILKEVTETQIGDQI